MKEVSCRVLQALFQTLEKKQLPPELLAEGTDCKLHHLRDRNERIDWSEFCIIARNAERILSYEELIEAGGRSVRSRHYKPFIAIGRLIFTVEDLYRWINDPVKGVGRQLITCITPEIVKISKNRFHVALTLQPGYEMCEAFFVLTRGALKYTPLLVGGAPADVDMHMTERGAVFEILASERTGLFRRFRLAISYPFMVGTAVRELQEAHELLVSRYSELAKAKEELARQAVQLGTAHRINQSVRDSLNLDDRVTSMTEALIDVARFAAVELCVSAEMDAVHLQRHETRGIAKGPAPLVFPLTRHASSIGELRLWPEPHADMEERRELLTFVTPIIAVALEEALAYTALSDYRENLDRKVRERTAELMEAQRARNRIFANVNHEIRTPLTLILLAVEHLREHEGVRRTDILNAIEYSAQQLVRLVDGLLLLAARQEGKLVVVPRSFDLGRMFVNMVEVWTVAAAVQQVSLEYEGPVSCIASLDAEAIERIIANLLSNALKYTPEGGSVVLRLSESVGYVLISVSDTGPGIDSKLRQRLFDRFERGETAQRTGTRGSGIGLSLVKELAEAHGGDVSVQSDSGEGSVFLVRIPLVRNRTPPEPRSLTQWPKNFGHGVSSLYRDRKLRGPASANATILVAEDDLELGTMIGRLLSKEYHVLLAENGGRAIELARRYRPDLLVSDIEMPGLDGLELTRQWCQLFDRRLAPVLLLTAYGRLEDRLAGFDAGAIDFVLKPFEPLELLARVRSQLEMRSMALRLLETEHLRAENAEYRAKNAEAELLSATLKAERDRREMQQQFLQQLITSQEKERRRIAGDLHDSLGQELVVIRIRATMGLRVIDQPERLRVLLEQITESTASLMHRVREISHNLRPAELARLGLTSALQSMFDRLATDSTTEWNAEIDVLDDLFDEEHDIILYRILQEAANNIIKHARASVADVYIHRKSDHLRIIIEDDGCGFPASERDDASANIPSGFGMRGMGERIQMLNGRMSLESEAGEGTRIEITLPLPQEA